MDNKLQSGYLSCIGFNLLQPITDNLEKLERYKGHEPNEVQASPHENGYAVSAILLTIVLLESSIGRTQIIKNSDKKEEIICVKKPLQFVKENYKLFFNEIRELLVLRDVIVHNHIWDAQIQIDYNYGMKFISADLLDGYGDNKFSEVINIETRKTKLLELNLFPPRVNRSDVVKVLKKVCDFLLYLENENKSYVYISPQPVLYKGEGEEFIKVIKSLK